MSSVKWVMQEPHSMVQRHFGTYNLSEIAEIREKTEAVFCGSNEQKGIKDPQNCGQI